MSRREGNRQRGFTLIELLIVVAIVGIIAAILIPNFLNSIQKGRQKRTLADMRTSGTAMMSWLTDLGGAAAAGAATTVAISDFAGTGDLTAIRTALVPQYVQRLPEADGWGHPFDYRLELADPSAARAMLIVSYGRDGAQDDGGGTYTIGSFPATDFDQDLVWADGTFLRFPDR